MTQFCGLSIKCNPDVRESMKASNLMESMSVSGQDSRFQTPRRQFLKVQESFVKLQYLQNTGESSVGRDPTEKELCECIIMINDRLPECRLGRVIQLLNDTLIRSEQEAKRKREKPVRLLQQDDYLSDDGNEQNITELEKKRMQQEYARKFQNSDANPRFYQEREIAKLFCLKGYGYPTAREFLGDNITPNRYNNVITTIVRLSYRKLQYFITKYINPRLVSISREQLKMIKTPLVNCKSWMDSRHAENFHRFVKLTYKIPTDDPEKEVAMDLLNSIMLQLRKRNVTYKHHRRGEEHAGWTQEMEQNLIHSYFKNPDIDELRSELLLLHPGTRSAFETNKLKIKIDRLIRYSVKKANTDREKFGIIEASPISDFFTNKIIRSSCANEVRDRLLAYYLDRDRTALKVRWVFEAVREYIENSKQEIQQIEDSSYQAMPKQELKAQEPTIIPIVPFIPPVPNTPENSDKDPKIQLQGDDKRKKEEDAEAAQ